MTAKVRVRSPRGKHVSYCSFCKQTVGVVQDKFNHRFEPEHERFWRLCRHRTAPGPSPRCDGSGSQVHRNTVMENKVA